MGGGELGQGIAEIGITYEWFGGFRFVHAWHRTTPNPKSESVLARCLNAALRDSLSLARLVKDLAFGKYRVIR